jgi:signal transduction histidine kinase
LVLGLVCARVLFPWPPAAQALLGFALLWALHAQVDRPYGRRSLAGRWLGHAALAAGTLSVAGAALTGYWETVPSRLLYGFLIAPLSAYVCLEHFGHGGPSAGHRAGRPAWEPVGPGYAAVVTALLAGTTLEVLFPGFLPASLGSLSTAWIFLAVCGYSLASAFAPAFRGLAVDPGPPGRPPPELRAARVRLAESERSLRALDRLAASSLIAAGTVHELRGSLSGILIGAQYALRRDPPARVREALERIVEHARDGELAVMRHLEPVLDFGREEARPVDLQGDLEELYAALRVACRRSGVSLVVRVEPGVVVRVHHGELVQVLLSLARNALTSLAGGGGGPSASAGGDAGGGAGEETEGDAGGARGAEPVALAARAGCPRLEIRAACWEGEAVVEVADNGPGIAPGQAGKLFERAASGTGSTGLGLYLSRMLAERNGGTLEYVPVEIGCCFRLSLPLVDPS